MAMRRQCAKCPWKTSTDPRDIPDGYCVRKHRALSATIAEPAALDFSGPLFIFACHQGRMVRPCVGWLVHQLGVGNNLRLRLAVALGHVDADVRTVGEQHARFEDTLPNGGRHG
jgi:hypothetical protein